jgi:CheY-like chemotaxis protein
MIVTDWQMPGMDGLQFCQTVRKQATYALIPIIMLSANVEPVGEAGCWSAFFRKPVSLDVLMELIFRVSTVGRITRQAFLECGDCAMSRWQGVDARAWP